MTTHLVFSERLRTKTPEFTALYLMSSATAFSAISALADCGFRVPDDISVIAADNVDQAAYFLPPVTCIDADAEVSAAKVIGAGPASPPGAGAALHHEIIDSSVVERGSVRTLPHPAGALTQTNPQGME